MKTITGKITFATSLYGKNFKDFLDDMNESGCEIVNIDRFLLSYTVTVRGNKHSLLMARYYFNNYGTLF